MSRIPSAFSGYDDPNHVPLLFQVISPDFETPLLPHFLYMHVNPNSLEVSYQKIITRIQTEGGFVEQHFGDQLTDISSAHSSGAFISVENGVTVFNRRNTIAYKKFYDLVDLFKNNGSVHDDRGNIQFQGRIRIVFGAGIYDGYFKSLDIQESAENPFNLTASWSFKVVKESQNLVY